MPAVGEMEKRARARVVALFHERLHDHDLGDCSDKDSGAMARGIGAMRREHCARRSFSSAVGHRSR